MFIADTELADLHRINYKSMLVQYFAFATDLLPQETEYTQNPSVLVMSPSKKAPFNFYGRGAPLCRPVEKS